MITLFERKLIADRTAEWRGPNAWGWNQGYRLSIQEAIRKPEFG